MASSTPPDQPTSPEPPSPPSPPIPSGVESPNGLHIPERTDAAFFGYSEEKALQQVSETIFIGHIFRT